jgi:sugar transferase (PEP-CTERM/EpsH1 system associated)
MPFVTCTETGSSVPLVVHVLYRFEVGGLQTLLAQCINRMPAQHYRHAVICLAGHTTYANLVHRPDVQFHTLDKQPGQSFSSHRALWTLLRRLRPAVLHTYNISTIEYGFTAWLAGVPLRIHAEHGRDSVEMSGRHRKYNTLRRLLAPFVDTFVPVSADLGAWLRHTVGVPQHKIRMIANGVDTTHFTPGSEREPGATPTIWIGTVGRIDRIKNHDGLLDAFALLLAAFPLQQADLRLAIVGDGPLLPALRERVAREAWGHQVWLPGARADVAQIMRSFSVFVLPSLSEGTPVTIMEAMATGLPVVASRVGGVPQLVLDGQTGLLSDPADPHSLAGAIGAYIADPALAGRHGAAGRARVQAHFCVDTMVMQYDTLYGRHRRPLSSSHQTHV